MPFLLSFLFLRIVRSQACDDHLLYAIDDGTLTVTGDGSITSSCVAPILSDITHNVIIDEGVRSISSRAFSGLKARRISLPKSLTVISEYAFSDASISSITFPEFLETIEPRAFLRTKFSSARIRIPARANVSSLAFELTEGIEAFEVHPDNPYLRSDAEGCLLSKDYTVFLRYPTGSAKKAYDVNYNVTQLSPDGPFGAAKKLTEIDLRFTTIEELPDRLFDGLSSLLRALVPVTVLSIGSNVFRGTKVKEFYIPDRVQSIAPSAFYSSVISDLTVSFRSVHFQVEDGMLYTFDQKKLVYAPAGEPYDQILIEDEVTEIGGFAFDSVKAPGLILPPSVKIIGEKAFARSSFGYFVLPNGIESVGKEAFANAKIETLGIGEVLQVVADAFVNATIKKLVYIGEGAASEELCAALKNGNNVEEVGVGEGSGIKEVCGNKAVVITGKLPWEDAPDNVDRTPLPVDGDEDWL